MRKAPQAENLLIAGPAGNVEALLEQPPSGEVRGAVVVCHPHPVQGGTMQNKVAHTLARAFLACDFAALRFNFRGVGQSEGQFDQGEGELQDTVAMARWLAGRYPSAPQWVAGFSFGAAVAIRAAAAIDADGLISVAPAISRVTGASGPQPGCPWLVIQGADDELVDPDDTIAWLNSLDPGPELEIMRETGHFFHGKLVPLRETVENFVSQNLAPRE